MSFLFTDIPRFVPVEEYQRSIDEVIDRLKALPGLISIYQVGGVSTPGISDIDLFVVFGDKVKVESNPIENLSANGNYLFTHNLFGTSESFVSEVEQYTCFGKYNLLYGKDLDISRQSLASSEEKIIKKQIALEYLVKAMITSSIEHSYHTVKLRNLFLHAKALLIDLSFLGISSGKMNDAIHEIMKARNRWFEHSISREELRDLARQYHLALYVFISDILTKEKFYLDKKSSLDISRNISLEASAKFSVERKGLKVPRMIVKLHQKVPKILNRMNRFSFHLPAQQNSLPEVVERRHQFIASMLDYQKEYLPHFIPTAYGLNIFNRKEK